MSDITIEQVVKEIHDLQQLVLSHRADPATLDEDKVKALFAKSVEQMVDEQVKARLADAPVRRYPGETVWAESVEKSLPQLKQSGNRYYRMVKEIASHGYYADFGGLIKIKAVDLWLANLMLEKQMQLKHAAMSGQALPPSEDLKAALKALSSTGSATGDELVPTEMASELWEDFFLASKIVPSLTSIPMPSNPFDVPLGLGDVTWRKGTENSATTASDPATAKSTLTVTEEVTEQNWSYTLQEDAVVAMAPTLRQRLAISGAENMDGFALNADGTDADTGNINLDDANPANDLYYLSSGQDGIRHQWLVDNPSQTVNAGGDALADSDVLSMLVKMGKYAVEPSQCRIACDVSTYLKGFLNLDTVITIDKFGPKATVVTGQIAAYRGIPILVSASHPLAEDDGKVSTTSGNNTLGSISCWNNLMWYVGFIRDLMMEMDRDIQKRMYMIVTSFRMAIGAHGTRASNTHTAGIRNILVS